MFTQELVDCDGSDPGIIAAEECTIEYSRLLSAPFLLPFGSSIHAQVDAQNFYGTSKMSEVGNGALILTVPSMPVNLVEDWSVKGPRTIGLQWEKAPGLNGGTDIIDYRINYD